MVFFGWGVWKLYGTNIVMIPWATNVELSDLSFKKLREVS